MYRQKKSLMRAIAGLATRLGIDQADVARAVADELDRSYAEWLKPLEVRLPKLAAEIAELSRKDAQLRRELRAAEDSVARISRRVSDRKVLLERKTETLASLRAEELKLREALSEVNRALKEARKGVDTIKYERMMKSSKQRQLTSGHERFLRILLTVFTILGIAIAFAFIWGRT